VVAGRPRAVASVHGDGKRLSGLSCVWRPHPYQLPSPLQASHGVLSPCPFQRRDQRVPAH
jgi:hypothetical protein